MPSVRILSLLPSTTEIAAALGLGEQLAAEWTNLDAIADLDPDVLVLAPCGFDLARTRSELPALTADPRFPALRAVRNGRVALVDAFLHMSRPGPRIAESLEILAEILHPDVPELAFGWRGRGWEEIRG